MSSKYKVVVTRPDGTTVEGEFDKLMVLGVDTKDLGIQYQLETYNLGKDHLCAILDAVIEGVAEDEDEAEGGSELLSKRVN